jgi:hypothetical protein
MSKFGEDLSRKIHPNLKRLFRSRKGEILKTAEIKHLYEAEYKYPDLMWVQPPDHSINTTNKGACWCAKTEEAIFEQIRRGLYKVRVVDREMKKERKGN